LNQRSRKSTKTVIDPVVGIQNYGRDSAQGEASGDGEKGGAKLVRLRLKIPAYDILAKSTEKKWQIKWSKKYKSTCITHTSRGANISKTRGK
jgi:hypothetical protein